TLLEGIGEQQRSVVVDDDGLVLGLADLEDVRAQLALGLARPDERHDACEYDHGHDDTGGGRQDHHAAAVRLSAHLIHRTVARSTRGSRSPGEASLRADTTATRMPAGSGSGRTLSRIPSCDSSALVRFNRDASS